MFENLHDPDCLMSTILFLTAIILAVMGFIFVFFASRHDFIVIRLLKAIFWAALTCAGTYIVLTIIFHILRIYVFIVFVSLCIGVSFFNSLDDWFLRECQKAIKKYLIILLNCLFSLINFSYFTSLYFLSFINKAITIPNTNTIATVTIAFIPVLGKFSFEVVVAWFPLPLLLLLLL